MSDTESDKDKDDMGDIQTDDDMEQDDDEEVPMTSDEPL